MLLFHVATEADWMAARAAGRYERSTYGRSLVEVGFVHACASHAQVDAVLGSFYADVREPLRLLVIDPGLLDSPWQLDDVAGHSAPYPHVYGPIRVDAVVGTTRLKRRDDGWTYPWLTPALPTGGRVGVRAVSNDDHPLLLRWTVERRLRTHLGGPCDADLAESQRGRMEGPGGFTVTVDGQGAGFVTLGEYRTGEPEISYVLMPEHQGHGHARNAVPLVTDWLFATRPDLQRLVAVMRVANHPSRRLLESCDWTEVRRFVEFGEAQVRYELPAPTR